MEQPVHSSMRRDIISAYVATGSRIGSWVIISAILYRYGGADAFALVALVRGTIGILNYTSVGLAPALIHLLAEATRDRHSQTGPALEAATAAPEGPVLSYATPATPQGYLVDPVRSVYVSGFTLAGLSAMVGVAIVLVYSESFPDLFQVPRSWFVHDISAVAFFMGIGTVLRVSSDAGGAVLQSRGRIARDNLLVAGGEAAWVLAVLVLWTAIGPRCAVVVALGYSFSGGLLLISRYAAANVVIGPWEGWGLVNTQTVGRLLAFGLLVTLAQLADYLYAPTDYILINRLLRPIDVATYAPAVQIDAGLLVLVSGLAAVLLPKSALAHAAGDTARLRRYYVRGTLASLAILTLAAAGVCSLSPWIFRLWFDDPMSATCAILPLVLVHTVVGGSSAVGRSILLGMGKVKPFTAAALVAGGSNVVLSFVFVQYLGLGLRGIVLGTIVVVVGRCAVWMPWYVLRTLRHAAVSGVRVIEELPPDPQMDRIV